MLALRTGSLVWRGAVSSASVLNSGTGTVYVSGVRDSVSVNLSGLGIVVVDAASGVGPMPVGQLLSLHSCLVFGDARPGGPVLVVKHIMVFEAVRSTNICELLLSATSGAGQWPAGTAQNMASVSCVIPQHARLHQCAR